MHKILAQPNAPWVTVINQETLPRVCVGFGVWDGGCFSGETVERPVASDNEATIIPGIQAAGHG